MTKLHTSVTHPQHLSENLIDTMFALYATYYGGTNAALFRHDLADKDYVLLLHDDNECLRGFSTLKVIPFVHQGTAVRVLFSGDTIIDYRFWGEQTLPLAWCHLVGHIKAQQPQTPLYWLLIVKGDRTYRYLNIFSKQYYPNRRYATPAPIQDLMDRLAQHRFGDDYDIASGIVRYARSHGHLKTQWHNTKSDGNVEAQFFAQRNPHYAQGDELVCLTHLEANNLRSFALRGFLQGLADTTLIGV